MLKYFLNKDTTEKTCRRTENVLFWGSLTLGLCFIWMGFMPLFDKDPLLAKFFRCEYRDRYMDVAFAYRFAQAFLATVLSIGIVMLIQKKSWRLVSIPFIFGVLTPVFVQRLKNSFSGGLVAKTIAIQEYFAIYYFFTAFYNSLYISLISLLAASYILYEIPRRKIFRSLVVRHEPMTYGTAK